MKKALLFVAALAATFATANALTYNVTVPAGTNACYIAGGMNDWGFTEMTKVDDTHYTITLDAATKDHGYKYCSGPAWNFQEQDANGEDLGSNRTYSENDEVVKWKSVFDPSVPTVYSIKHPWKDGAKESWSYKELTDNGDGTYSIDDYYGGAGCNWKSNKGAEIWIGNPTLVGSPAVGDAARFTLSNVDGGGTITITKLDGGGDGGDSSDPTTNITIRVQIPEGLSGWDYSVAPNLYYWTTGDGTFAEMTLADGWYSYTVNAATVNFIVVNGSSWEALNKDSRRQSVNMEGVTTSGCYILGNGTEIEGNGDTWKKTVTSTDCDGSTPDPKPSTTDYYLVGYINGADYGFGDDYKNLGDYKFVDGKLKATFNEPSYVCVKTGDNAKWYLSEVYVAPAESATATLKIGSETVFEKVGVPGNVEITFTLVENGDGTLTLSYTTVSTALDNPEMVNIYATNGRIENIGTGRIYTVSGLDVTDQNGSLQGIYIVKLDGKAHKIAVK